MCDKLSDNSSEMSQRTVKYQFTEGERVLCYEPDPNKAKVLYDSKVLEVFKNRKCIQYLVHFSGWNSSWDRCVNEENILKDTAENRQLQRELAEIAAQQLNTKKLKLNKIPAIIKEVVLDNRSANGEKNGTDHLPNGETNGHDSVLQETTENDEGPFELDQQLLELPDELKKILENDQQMIADGKIYRLPQVTSIELILQEFFSHMEIKIIEKETRNAENNSDTSSSKCDIQNGVLDESPSMVVREFVSSIAIHFNSIVADFLFYNEIEKQQFFDFQRQNENRKWTSIFGFIHLLRFLVVLPDFIAATDGFTRKRWRSFYAVYTSFIEFIIENREKLKSEFIE